MTRRATIRMLGILIVIFATSTNVWACSCKPFFRKTPLRALTEIKFNSHDLVFEGTVISEFLDSRLKPDQDRNGYIFQVHRSYKGGAEGTIEILTGRSTCSPPFSVGQSFLVYAYNSEGGFATGLCSGNQDVETMGPDLRFLRGEPPEENDFLTIDEYYARRVANARQPPGHICGRVTFGTTEAIPRHRTLYIWPQETWLGLSRPIIREISAQGTFCEEVPSGEYQVSALSFVSPKGERTAGIYGDATSLQTAPWISVNPQQKLADIDVRLLPYRTATIEGIVKVGDRPPLPDETITVWLQSFHEDTLKLRRKTQTDATGRFEFQKVPGGFWKLYATYEGPNQLNSFSDSKVVSTLRDATQIQLTFPVVFR